MNLLERITRFLEAGWKEQATCLTLVRELQQHIYTYRPGSIERKELQKKLNRLQSLYSEIGRLTRGTNPSVVYEGTPLLPCVAWIPQPVLDDETGIAVTPPMPSLPDFENKADRCAYLKSLADAELEDKREQECVEDYPSVDETTAEEPLSENTDEQPAEDKDLTEVNAELDTKPVDDQQEEQPTPAQQAIAAIRSRRKKKTSQ